MSVYRNLTDNTNFSIFNKVALAGALSGEGHAQYSVDESIESSEITA